MPPFVVSVDFWEWSIGDYAVSLRLAIRNLKGNESNVGKGVNERLEKSLLRR